MDELKHYVHTVKKNMDTMNAPEYEGKEDDLKNQKEDLEEYEKYFKSKTTSPEQFDQLVSAAVDCASNEMSISELEGVYGQYTE